MKRILFGFIFSIGVWSSLHAQSKIEGRIIDNDSGEGLIGVTILITETGKGTVTDLEGGFVLKGVSNGNYTIRVSYVGFEEKQIPVKVQGADIKLETLTLKTTTIGLNEVEIFADVIDDRKTPVAVTTISAEEVRERFSGLSVPEVINSTPGVYMNQGAGGYGDQEVYIRGFSQNNVAFMINGIPVNDMENGNMFWSNFAGISEATRQMQVQRGLGASKLAISSIGGTVNMISQPADNAQGGKIEYQASNGSWNNRYRFTYNTGTFGNGWAATFQGSRSTTTSGISGLSAADQGAMRPGAFVDAYSYYLAISKKINSKHQLMFYGFGAPVNRGSAWYIGESLKEAGGFQDNPVHFNYATGFKNGEFFNARQNKTHKPQFSLSHYWDINKDTYLSTSAYVSIARVYSVQPRITASNTNRTTLAVRDTELRTSEGYINWDLMEAENQDAANTVTLQNPNSDPFAPDVTGQSAVNFLESRHNDHEWFGVISNFKTRINRVNILAGVDLRHYKGSHYTKAFDLLGADFIENIDRGEYDNNNAYDMDLLRSNEVIKKGDRFMYDYDGYVLWGSGFAQAEMNLNKLDLFMTLSGTQTQYYRVGNNWNEEFRYNSLGESEKKNFFSYTVKTGANYRFNNRHNIFANLGHFTRPPFLRNSFQDSRFSNDYNLGLQKEKIYGAETGYLFRAGFLKASVNAYYTLWQDRTINASASGQVDAAADQQDIDQQFFNISGLDAVHKGIEADFKWNVLSSLELNGFVSLGDWKWQNNVTVQSPFDSSQVVQIFAKGLPTGNAAQHTVGLGFHYKGIKNMYIGSRINYSGKLYVQHDPSDEFLATQSPEKLDNYTLTDAYMGYYFDFGPNIDGRLSFSVNNVFDKTYVRWATEFFGRNNAYGFNRNYFIGLTLTF